MPNLDLTPEQKSLQAEIMVQKDLFVSLFIRLNDLTHTVKPNLESTYLVKIGSRELQLFYQQARVAGLKFKMELMIACINNKQAINMEETEREIELKLKSYYQDIKIQAEKIDKAQLYLSSLLSPEDSTEIKKLFYQAAKWLHPDVNPDLTNEQRQLWDLISTAYNDGDLQTVRTVWAAIQGFGDIPETMSAFDELQTKLEFLKGRNQSLLSKIDALQSDFPFTHIVKLEDEKWLASEIQRIESQMKELMELENKYLNYINLMLEV